MNNVDEFSLDDLSRTNLNTQEGWHMFYFYDNGYSGITEKALLIMPEAYSGGLMPTDTTDRGGTPPSQAFIQAFSKQKVSTSVERFPSKGWIKINFDKKTGDRILSIFWPETNPNDARYGSSGEWSNKGNHGWPKSFKDAVMRVLLIQEGGAQYKIFVTDNNPLGTLQVPKEPTIIFDGRRSSPEPGSSSRIGGHRGPGESSPESDPNNPREEREGPERGMPEMGGHRGPGPGEHGA